MLIVNKAFFFLLDFFHSKDFIMKLKAIDLVMLFFY